jgi:hypothetical protein
LVPLIFAKGSSPGTFKSAFAIKREAAAKESAELIPVEAAPEVVVEETKPAPAGEAPAEAKVLDEIAAE